jgi:hypothetical protein
MTQSEAVTDRTTLAIILGAAEFPHAPVLSGGPAYANSASGFREYLSAQFRLSDPNVLYLFDDARSPSDMDDAISRFLRARVETLSTAGTPARDLIFYYVGHGGFVSQDYYLAIRATREGSEGVSGLRMSDLARTIIREARTLRRYLILDCCFAAAAYEEFMAVPADVAKRKTLEQFPKHGTALLCASGPRDPARAPKDSLFTVFSQAMLNVLRNGVKTEEGRLSLKVVGDETLAFLQESCPDDFARPQVLSPDLSDGDVATVLLFPNTARVTTDLRLEALSDQVADLTRIVGLLETRFVSLTKETPAVAPIHESASPSPAAVSIKEPEPMAVGRRTPERFYLTEAQWNTIPMNVKTWLIRCRRANVMGSLWIVLAAVLLIGVAWMLVTAQTIAAAWIWGVGIVLSASITLTFIGFVRTIRQERREETDAPQIPAIATEPWHNLEIVAKYATTKTFKVVGGLHVCSPFFEIAAIVFIVSATGLGFLVYNLLTRAAATP